MDDPEIYEKSKFYRTHKNSKAFLEYYWRKLYCVDEFIDIHGNYNSADASALQISFVKCDPSLRKTCKSDEEITNFMKRLFMVHLNNSVRFDQIVYSDQKLAEESKFHWHPIRSTQKAEVIYEIENKELTLQDSQFFSLGSVFELSQKIFDVKHVGERPYEFKDRVHFTVSFEMSQHLHTVDREVYHALDWIGDMGGLLDGKNVMDYVGDLRQLQES